MVQGVGNKQQFKYVRAATWALRRVIIPLWSESRWAGSQQGKLGARWRTRGNENIGRDDYGGEVAEMPCAPGSE